MDVKELLQDRDELRREFLKRLAALAAAAGVSGIALQPAAGQTPPPEERDPRDERDERRNARDRREPRDQRDRHDARGGPMVFRRDQLDRLPPPERALAEALNHAVATGNVRESINVAGSDLAEGDRQFLSRFDAEDLDALRRLLEKFPRELVNDSALRGHSGGFVF